MKTFIGKAISYLILPALALGHYLTGHSGFLFIWGTFLVVSALFLAAGSFVYFNAIRSDSPSKQLELRQIARTIKKPSAAGKWAARATFALQLAYLIFYAEAYFVAAFCVMAIIASWFMVVMIETIVETYGE